MQQIMLIASMAPLHNTCEPLSICYIWSVYMYDIFSLLLPFCPSQSQRWTGLQSPAWPNVLKGLLRGSSWRTTVYLWWERRSCRRCPRRRWPSTTSAVCWTKPPTLRRDPGISLIFISCWLRCSRVLLCSFYHASSTNFQPLNNIMKSVLVH